MRESPGINLTTAACLRILYLRAAFLDVLLTLLPFYLLYFKTGSRIFFACVFFFFPLSAVIPGKPQ